MKCPNPKCKNERMKLSIYDPERFVRTGIPKELIKFIDLKKMRYYTCWGCLTHYVIIFPNGRRYLYNTDVMPLHWERFPKREKVVFT